ncbi:hypothetical protein HK102_011122, partial [Quaeritorhiza haematococci]
LLRQRKISSIVALNKIDRIYDCGAVSDNRVHHETDKRMQAIIVAGVEQGLYGETSNVEKGGCAQDSTLGSVETLLTFLKQSSIPISGINIGPVHKNDIIRASVMLERIPEYAQLLPFEVLVDNDAQDLADELGVKMFKADII